MRPSILCAIVLGAIFSGVIAMPIERRTEDDTPMSHCITNCVYHEGTQPPSDNQQQGGGQGGLNNVLGGGVNDVAGTVLAPVNGALGN
ncbi:hypothetical protein FE257_007174 [Aspergillus nanangensis]|uniref:Uncharacterized protein n=1 Tax=Aspergillus nanangensis TaxID=2582783 RepID=A0AAD4CNC5_ASPNN|nr:hypothetical protein FE257_007174 [Aspergillus nanangensis]